MDLPTNITKEQIQNENDVTRYYNQTKKAVDDFSLTSLQTKINTFDQVGKNKIRQYHLIGNGDNKPTNRNKAIYLIQS